MKPAIQDTPPWVTAASKEVAANFSHVFKNLPPDSLALFYTLPPVSEMVIRVILKHMPSKEPAPAAKPQAVVSGNPPVDYNRLIELVRTSRNRINDAADKLGCSSDDVAAAIALPGSRLIITRGGWIHEATTA